MPQLHPKSSPAYQSCPLLLHPLFTPTIPQTPKLEKTGTSGFPSSLETLVLHALLLTHSPTMVTCKHYIVYRAPRLTRVS
jgi:hypothetical protein